MLSFPRPGLRGNPPDARYPSHGLSITLRYGKDSKSHVSLSTGGLPAVSTIALLEPGSFTAAEPGRNAHGSGRLAMLIGIRNIPQRLNSAGCSINLLFWKPVLRLDCCQCIDLAMAVERVVVQIALADLGGAVIHGREEIIDGCVGRTGDLEGRVLQLGRDSAR